MTRTLRNLVLAAAGAATLAACGGLIGLPEPVELDTAFGFGTGVEVSMTAPEVSGVATAQTGATYTGEIDETFVIESADIPAILQTLVRIDAVTETLSFDTALTVSTADAATFPESFVVSGAALTDLTVARNGSTILGPLSFTGFASAEMTFTADAACVDVTSCDYTASTQVDLLEIGLTAAAANAYAKTIVDGGTFRVQADFSVDVDPALPAGSTIDAVVIGTGAVLE